MTMIIVSLLITSVLSGKVCLQEDTATVEWTLTDQTIDYTLTLTPKILEQCDWLSIGFFFSDVYIISADVNIVVLENYVLDGNINSTVVGIDTNTRGKDDIINASYDSATLTHKWSKLLNTSDLANRDDILLYDGEELVMYNDCGAIINGLFTSYGFANVEIVDIVLDDGTYNCRDLISQEN